MLTINVAPDGSGQFTTISEAVLAVPYDCPAVIRIAPGIYREKLVCEKKDITLAGAGMDATRLVWNDGGKLPHPDGRPTHTFRSYTAFFSGEKLRVEDMTIENDAPAQRRDRPSQPMWTAPGRRSAACGCWAIRIPCSAPLCRRKSGRRTASLARGCWHPAGQAHSITTPARSPGTSILSLAGRTPCLSTAPCARWITALRTAGSPRLPARRMGWALCSGTAILSPAGSVYLGRPWRPTGKTAVLDCRLGAHIAPEGFAGWNDRTDTALAGFAEAGSTGAGAGERPGWVQAFSAAEAAALLRAARQKCRMKTTERITE